MDMMENIMHNVFDNDNGYSMKYLEYTLTLYDQRSICNILMLYCYFERICQSEIIQKIEVYFNLPNFGKLLYNFVLSGVLKCIAIRHDYRIFSKWSVHNRTLINIYIKLDIEPAKIELSIISHMTKENKKHASSRGKAEILDNVI